MSKKKSRPGQKPRKLNVFQALGKSLRGQGSFYTGSTWSNIRVSTDDQARARRKQHRARAAVIIGSVLTLGAWHLPMTLVATGKTLHKRNRARREFVRKQETDRRHEAYRRSLESTFNGLWDELRDGYGMTNDDVRLVSKVMLYRLGLGQQPAENRAYESDFRELYAALEEELRESPDVARLFDELGID